MRKTDASLVEKEKGEKTSKKPKISKNDALFLTLIIITLISGFVISISSRKYVKSLREQNPTYYYPTLYEIIIKTTVLTFILLIPKVLIEKALYPLTEYILIDKYDKEEFKHEKKKARRKMAIYALKTLHYLLLTIHHYYVLKDVEYFPKELLGKGDISKLYYKGLKSFSFFDRPAYFDLHYLLNLAYTFADLICVLFIYDGQTDILVMLFHHLCTISLIVFSYYNHHDSIGALILFLHNASDIVVYYSRTMIYVVFPEIIKKGIVISLMIAFIYFRIYFYGKLIYSFIFNGNWKSYGINEAFKFLLISLYILHCDWAYKIIKITYNGATKGKFNDSRDFVKDKKK